MRCAKLDPELVGEPARRRRRPWGQAGVLDHHVDRRPLALAPITLIADAEVFDALGREGKILFQAAPEIGGGDAPALAAGSALRGPEQLRNQASRSASAASLILANGQLGLAFAPCRALGLASVSASGGKLGGQLLGRIRQALVQLDDPRLERLALLVEEAGQAHDARQIMDRRIAPEPRGDRLLEGLELLERTSRQRASTHGTVGASSRPRCAGSARSHSTGPSGAPSRSTNTARTSRRLGLGPYRRFVRLMVTKTPAPRAFKRIEAVGLLVDSPWIILASAPRLRASRRRSGT